MLALLLAMAIAQEPEADVVVTGTRLDEAYAECMARRCSPLRDAQVSIARAERAFRKGDYLDAKRGLAAAIARNRSSAATAPKPVAALYEAYGTVTLHEGDLDAYRSAVSAQVRTLRDNLPAEDPAVGDAQLALGDMWLKAGDTRNAMAAYERAQQAGIEHGQSATSLQAGLRLVMLANEQGRRAEANRLLEKVARSPVARDEAVQAIIHALRVRLAVNGGDKAEADRQIAALARTGSNLTPIMIESPPLQPVAATAAEDHANRYGDVNRFAPRSMEIRGLKWADIGYWIRPDGRTAEVAVLRSSGDSGWTGAAVDQISGRRYATFADNDVGRGVYRVERYTLRGNGYGVPNGSLIRRRIGPLRMEVLDITLPDAPSR